MPALPNTYFQFSGFTYNNGTTVGPAGGLDMRWRGALGAGPPDNITGDASTIMISDSGVWIPSPDPSQPNICFRNSPGTASVGFFTCPAGPTNGCYNGVTNTVAYMNTGGRIEFNLKLEVSPSQIGQLRLEFGKDADCLFYYFIQPASLSTTNFTRFSIGINDAILDCPLLRQKPDEIAFCLTAFMITMACGSPIFSLNDVRWVNY